MATAEGTCQGARPQTAGLSGALFVQTVLPVCADRKLKEEARVPFLIFLSIKAHKFIVDTHWELGEGSWE